MVADISDRRVYCVYFSHVTAGADAEVQAVDEQSVRVVMTNERLDTVLAPRHDRRTAVALANDVAEIEAQVVYVWYGILGFNVPLDTVGL